MSPPSRNTTARSLRLILRPQTGRFHAVDYVHGLLRSRTSFCQNVSSLYRFPSRRNSQKQLFWDFYTRTRKSPWTHDKPEPAVRRNQPFACTQRLSSGRCIHVFTQRNSTSACWTFHWLYEALVSRTIGFNWRSIYMIKDKQALSSNDVSHWLL